MRSKSTGQGPRYSRILLEDNYALSHTNPDLQPSSTGETVDLTRAAGWPEKPRLHRHLKLSNRGQKSARLPACRRLFCQRFEWFSLKLPVLLQQDLDFAFRLFQFLAAGWRKLHTFFEECQGFFQRDFPLFQFLNYFL